MSQKLSLKSDFFKYVLILVSGTASAQIISYALSIPIFRYFYVPEEGAELGIFMRIAGVGAAIATFRYEMALPIPKSNAHSFRLYRVAFVITMIATFASVVIFAVTAAFTGTDRVLYWLMLPLTIFFMAFHAIGTNWAIRFKQFKDISYTRFGNSLLGNGSKLFFGWMGVGYMGLIFGTIVGYAVSSFWFLREFFRSKKTYKIPSRSPRNYAIAKQYFEYPKINLPHVLLDLGRDLLVAAIILGFFSKHDYGLFDHSYRMLLVPMVFFGQAIGQVFFQRAADKVNQKQIVLPDMISSIRILTLASIIPFTTLFFFGEELFGFVFGDEWREAGYYSEIMTPWFMVNFVSSPITSLPLVLGKQKEFFHLAIFGSALIIGAISIPYLVFGADLVTSLWVLSISQVFYKLFLIFKLFTFAKEADAKIELNEN
ncbi:MAG: hypothetical protein DCO96_08345 [Fluviicola sp. XM-24bin1]|nr:MAG: hypothetical protein DCO96_08345 [Fluviicola sp. XM-24bin1]